MLSTAVRPPIGELLFSRTNDVEVSGHPLKTDSFGIFSLVALATTTRGHCRRWTSAYGPTLGSTGDRAWCVFVKYVAMQEHDKRLGLVDHKVMSVPSSRGARSIRPEREFRRLQAKRTISARGQSSSSSFRAQENVSSSVIRTRTGLVEALQRLETCQ